MCVVLLCILLPLFIASLLAINTIFSLLPLFITGLLGMNAIFAPFSLYFLLVILLMIISRLVLSLGVIVHVITLKGFISCHWGQEPLY